LQNSDILALLLRRTDVALFRWRPFIVRRSIARQKIPTAGKTWRVAMAKKVRPKKRPKPRKAIKGVKHGIPEPNINAVSDYLSETS
jgi:hypothetical protein